MSKQLADPSISTIVKDDVLGNILLHTQDINNPTGGSPLGESKKITPDLLKDYMFSKAVIVPTGTTQADAFELSKFDNIADAVGAGTGVVLPSDEVDYEAKVGVSGGAENMNVYPKSGSQLLVNGVLYAVDAPFVIEPYNYFTFKIYTAQIVRVF